jgi:hypothetical protein
VTCFRFVGILSAAPISADVALMKEMESNGVLVLGNGSETAARSDMLETVSQGFTNGGLEGRLCLCVDQVLGQLSKEFCSPLVLLGAEEEMVLCL